MLQNIEYFFENCLWVYIVIYVILFIIWIVSVEKENDILGKRLYKKIWQLPIVIKYKGRKLTIDRKEEEFKCGYFDCGWDERKPKKYTYFINDNPIVCITAIKYTLRYHYFTTLNYDYNTSDFKDIVGEAIRESRRQNKIRFSAKIKDNRKKLYELVNQGDSINGNG